MTTGVITTTTATTRCGTEAPKTTLGTRNTRPTISTRSLMHSHTKAQATASILTGAPLMTARKRIAADGARCTRQTVAT